MTTPSDTPRTACKDSPPGTGYCDRCAEGRPELCRYVLPVSISEAIDKAVNDLAAAQEKIKRKDAEIAGLRQHAEAMRYKLSQHLSRTSDIGTVEVIESYDAYRAAHPKEGK